ncbi:hypothetical protein IW261DRAFT_421753 [Armillaria novae-zelandiae]|uniref:Uncharacterized protein n=1 Tax=Armillaria novae-zelandiae TaxID=153914 RepID=A0AA39P3B3_9AGAR|nr:hypothetical protein IW261DRAFT_421753 [Armillaria novae-zelandiae]
MQKHMGETTGDQTQDKRSIRPLIPSVLSRGSYADQKHIVATEKYWRYDHLTGMPVLACSPPKLCVFLPKHIMTQKIGPKQSELMTCPKISTAVLGLLAITMLSNHLPISKCSTGTNVCRRRSTNSSLRRFSRIFARRVDQARAPGHGRDSRANVVAAPIGSLRASRNHVNLPNSVVLSPGRSGSCRLQVWAHGDDSHLRFHFISTRRLTTLHATLRRFHSALSTRFENWLFGVAKNRNSKYIQRPYSHFTRLSKSQHGALEANAPNKKAILKSCRNPIGVDVEVSNEQATSEQARYDTSKQGSI